MKLDIVPGWSAPKEEWNFDRKGCRSDRDQRFPPQAVCFGRVLRVRSRVRISQSVLLDRRFHNCNENCSFQFNPDLILLKP